MNTTGIDTDKYYAIFSGKDVCFSVHEKSLKGNRYWRLPGTNILFTIEKDLTHEISEGSVTNTSPFILTEF